MFSHPEPISDTSPLEGLRSSLQWLDRLIAAAVKQAQTLYGTEAISDAHRGLYIDDQEVERLLANEPGNPRFQINPPLDWKQDARLVWLQHTAELSDFDLALILVALAPEIDLRYERLYAYLQDDVTRKRPTVDLALNLLCASATDKLQRRQHFTAQAPLIRQQILRLIPDATQVESPLLAHILKLDEQVVQFLLGQSDLDRRLESFCQILQPAIAFSNLPIPPEIRQFLQTLTKQAVEKQESLKLHLQGVAGIGKRQIAAAIAMELNVPLLIADLPRALHLKLEVKSLLDVILREAQIKRAVLYLPGMNPSHDRQERQEQNQRHDDDQGLWQQILLEKLSRDKGVTILAGTQPWLPTTPYRSGIVSVKLDLPDFEQRRFCWQTTLTSAGYALESFEVDALANQFRLTPEQIGDAIAQAGYLAYGLRVDVGAGSRPPADQQPCLNHFFAAARNQSGHELQALAQKIQPSYRWEDIVLPPDQIEQLQEICNQVKYRQVVYQTWGYGRKLALGKGVTALFSGPSGTGKTMAAEVLAQDLQVDLYKIDLSQVVSKYIGETEKNLDRIFTAAETANVILFFDEADALFGKRSEVKDAHDRYANIEVGYLLQKVETYSGLAILATNLRQNLDDAFVRRLQAIVEFPFPDEEFRYQIWQVIFPPVLPIHADVDRGLLAREVKLPGGNIKNIGLAAAFYAAGDGGVLRMEHLIKAAQREHQKLGKSWHFQKG